MSHFFKNKINEKVEMIKIDKQQIQYLHFTKPSLAFKTPIIIINDGFYEFDVMAELLEFLKNIYPVYFITLPGFDENEIFDSKQLSNKEYANLIKSFCDQKGIDKINLLGISFSAVIAYNFASNFPKYINKLILQGITKSLKESTKLLIKENLKFLENQEYKKFAASFSMNILNFSRKEMINHSTTIHNKFYNKYKNINKKQGDMIALHLNRMLNQNILEGVLHCPTLVMAGQYDNFTTPYENFKVSKICTQSTFGILKRVDHFAVLEKNKMISKIYNSFFSEPYATNKVTEISGIDIYEDDFYPTTRRQIEPRYRWGESVTARFISTTKTVETMKEININIIDLNGQGCKVAISNLDNIDEIKDLQIDIFPDCTLNLLIFKENENNTYHGIFNHQSVSQTISFLDQFADKIDGKKSFKAA